MKDANRLSIGGFQLVAPQPLMLPDRLQQAFRRNPAFVVQNRRRDETCSPGGVEIFSRQKHFLNFLRLMPVKVKSADFILNAPNGRLVCS